MNINGGFFGKQPKNHNVAETLPLISHSSSIINPYEEQIVTFKESNLATPTMDDGSNFTEKTEKRKSILNKFKNMPLPEYDNYNSFESSPEETPTPMKVEPTHSSSKPLITLGLAATAEFEKELSEWEVDYTPSNDKKEPIMSIEVKKPQ
jgi:hypothetical protein